jgi:hypothetical protein
MCEDVTEIGQWIYRKQSNGKDQADRAWKIIGRCGNIFNDQAGWRNRNSLDRY